MKCSECEGSYIKAADTYEYVDPYVGIITISGLPYFLCPQCGDSLLSDELAEQIGIEREKKIREKIARYPIGDFVTASEAVSMLGITRQAFHKNRRIKRGFIYQTKLGDSTVYLKESVLKYKENGDGRFPLHRETVSNVA
jgi:YgiT-type zinc finger domain-containing protein